MSDPPVKTYSITFGAAGLGAAGVNIPALVQYLNDSADIIAFWNYIPLVYCVKSRLRATELAVKLRPFFPSGQFMIAEIDASNLDGVLPGDAWSWFYVRDHKKSHPPTLGDIFGRLPPPRKM